MKYVLINKRSPKRIKLVFYFILIDGPKAFCLYVKKKEKRGSKVVSFVPRCQQKRARL